MCTTIRPAWKHDPIHMQWRYGITLGLAGMTAWCFGMTVTRPSFYVHTAPLPTCLTVKHSTGKARWCNKCMAPKPDRCHHCRQCERCILRMDHHCPWLMDTCIGLRNYKPFLLFLVYAILLCVWTCDTLARGFLRHWDDSLAHNHAVDIPLAWLGLFGLAALVRHRKKRLTLVFLGIDTLLTVPYVSGAQQQNYTRKLRRSLKCTASAGRNVNSCAQHIYDTATPSFYIESPATTYRTQV